MVGKAESRRTNNLLINRFERNSPRGKLQWNWWNENDEKVQKSWFLWDRNKELMNY